MNYIKARKLSDYLLGAFILGLGIILRISAEQIVTGASLQQGGDHMPKIVGIFMIILGVCQILLAGKKQLPAKSVDDGERLAFKEKVLRFLLEFALLFAYILLLKSIGFIIMTTLFVFFQCWIITPKPKINFIKMAVLAVLTAIVSYLVFVNAFSLMLPAGILG